MRLALAALTLIIAGVVFLYFSHNRFSSMNTQELKAKVPLQPYCVGRLLIDMPADGDIIWGDGMVGDIQINAERMSMTSYLQQTKEREDELRKQPHEINGSKLISTMRLPDSILEGTLLQFWKHSDKSFVGYEGYKYVEGYRLTALAIDALEEGDALGKRKPYVLEALDVVKPLPKDISKLDGTCMLGGFVAGRKHGNERLAASLVWESKYPGLRVTIETKALEGQKESPQESLLKIVDARALIANELFPDSSIIRKRTRHFGIWKAEELAIVDKDKDGDESYTFKLQADQPEEGLRTPSINIEMKAARESYGKLSRDDLLALWDAVIDSIRVRPMAAR
jgi:hypothetical protein